VQLTNRSLGGGRGEGKTKEKIVLRGGAHKETTY
jgi:hypothetical protein